VISVVSHQSADFDPDVARILMRCASYPLEAELKELDSIIGSLNEDEVAEQEVAGNGVSRTT